MKLFQHHFRMVLLLSGIVLLHLFSGAQNRPVGAPGISTAPFGDSSRHWYGIADKSNIIQPGKNQPRYKESQVREIADNVLLYQRSNGGWPKNYDMQAVLTPEQRDRLMRTKDILHTTIDNSTSYTQVDYLAQAYRLLKDDRYKQAAIRGIEFLLSAQYPNGGWPQYYPIEQGRYSRYITFNDGAYIGVMKLFKKITDGHPDYAFLDSAIRQRVQSSFGKGLDCILKCQIVDMGVLTAWFQQHDNTDLTPAWARAFEPPSICNAESADIVLFLMSLENPSPAIIQSVKSAVEWFKVSEIHGVRVTTVPAPPEKSIYHTLTTDRIVVEDSLAPVIWTRYYELETHRPLFCDRNSKFLYRLSDVSRERRVGYGWYTYAPQKVLDAYPGWLEKHPQ
ncbi:MAG: pectate lyase [Bacteroidetes bacterium]|nr:pectate lyase [Bacteroidota bacterium]